MVSQHGASTIRDNELPVYARRKRAGWWYQAGRGGSLNGHSFSCAPRGAALISVSTSAIGELVQAPIPAARAWFVPERQ